MENIKVKNNVLVTKAFNNKGGFLGNGNLKNVIVEKALTIWKLRHD